MNKARWVSATAGAAMVAATLVLPAAGVAYASGNGNVTGNGNVSVLSGNTLDAPISLPVNLCGVSLGIVGFANSGCEGGASSNVSTDPSGGNGGGGNGGSNGNGNVVGNGNIGVGSGNTITAPISAPVNVCGVGSVAAGGFANSDGKGGSLVRHRPRRLQPRPRCHGRGLHPAAAGQRPGRAPRRARRAHGRTASATSACRASRTARTAPPGCHGQDCTPPGCHGSHCGGPRRAAPAATARAPGCTPAATAPPATGGTRTAPTRVPRPPSPTRPGRQQHPAHHRRGPAPARGRGGRHHRCRRGRRHAGPASPGRRGLLGKPVGRPGDGDAHRARLPASPSAGSRARACSDKRRGPAPHLPRPGACPPMLPSPGRAQIVRTARMIRLRRVAFLLPSALSESLDNSQSPYSAWSVRIRRAASRASRDVPRGRYTTR